MDNLEQGWFLEGKLEGESVPRRFSLRGFPTRIGRAKTTEVPLPSRQVSNRHAELSLQDGQLWLRDLGSSNGTYLNGERLTKPVRIENGDVIHFANVELLVGCETSNEDKFSETGIMMASPQAIATGLYSRARALRSLVSASSVQAVFQPIVSLHGDPRPAFEVLGRGADSNLPESPGPLFEIAEETGLAAELSQCFRRVGLFACEEIADQPRIYTNVHPTEIEDGAIIRELTWFRQRYPKLPLTAEVHESTITDPGQMRRLRASLNDIDVRLAYDDFGAGQARLLELADCPPDCLKFDMSLIRDLDKASDHKQRLVETLVRLAKETGAECLAEGVENAAELDICRTMGFDSAQGYFIARPERAPAWRSPWAWDRWCTEEDWPDDERTQLSFQPRRASN
ncbi:MAG: EAL domain-containing protein [Planctomycetota bacterium]